MTNTKPAAKKIPCPRCDGTGVYQTFGVCYRCHGRKVVTPTPARAKREALPAPTSPQELADRAGVSTEDAEAAFAYTWED